MREVLSDANEFCSDLVKHLSIRPASISLSVAESAELLLGKASLSQRAYKALRKGLKKKGVILASYESTISHINSLPIGRVSSMDCGMPSGCMCVTTNFKETMKLVMACRDLYQMMHFPSTEQSTRLLRVMNDKFPQLYGNSFSERPNNRVLLIRETGDNFRGAARHKTEQDSFNILNLRDCITSPLGQFVNGIWRGPETRKYLKAHLTGTYTEMDDCVRNGLIVTLPDGRKEHFNVIVFYVADLGHKAEVLGRASTTAKFGCLHCRKEINEWSKLSTPAAPLSTQDIIKYGNKAGQALGEYPDKDTQNYTNVHHACYGQVAAPLFSSFAAECNMACALHTILALHRQLWKYVDHVVSARKQSELLGPALRIAGCDYMAFQMDSYFSSKKKYYDGSAKLRMTGEDCRNLELNIRKFVQVSTEDSARLSVLCFVGVSA